MSSQERAFPLSWPPHRPRTRQRRPGKFRHAEADVTVAIAMRRVDLECTRLGAAYPLISSNVPRRLDGGIRSERPVDGDTGACLYFHLKGKPFALACDTYQTVEMNIAAIAAHLEATRAIERHGVATAAESLQAFSALPPPADSKPARPWWEVFGVVRDQVDADDIKALFRVKARKAHPDNGGSTDAMMELNLALEAATLELSK